VSARGTSRPERPPRGRAQMGGVPWWALALGALVLAGVAAYLLVLRPSTTCGPSSSSGLPGPIGGSDVAKDVNSMVCKPAPAFTLPDSEGKSYAVAPGQGKPLVLVFNMGFG